MKKIIALGYESRVGKSTVADLLFNYWKLDQGGNVSVVPLARKLKKICHQLFWAYGVRDEQYYENNPEERKKILWNNMTVVDIWIWYSQMMKQLDIEYWLKAQELRDVTIVPDVRFHEEIAYYRANYQCYFVRLISNRVERKGMDHHLDSFQEWDFTLVNNGSLAELSQNTKLLYEAIKEKLC